MKPIRLSDHALRYANTRGFTLNEIEDAIRTTPWRSAELGRLECRKDFDYGKEWNKNSMQRNGSGQSSSKKPPNLLS